MPELTGSQKEALELFISSADRLEKAVAGLPEEELDYSTAPGQWNIRQIVHHVATDGDAWSMPFRTALATPGAIIRFGGYPENEELSDALACEKRPIQTAVEHVKSHRRLLSELAEYFCDSWESYVKLDVGQKDKFPQVSAGQVIAMLGEHLMEHIGEIEAIKKQYNSEVNSKK